MTEQGRRTILVVDDDRDIVDTLCDILELEGWHTLRAYDGDEAVNVATSQTPDWILMDVRMPRLNGVQALRAIRKVRPATRAVLMTAFASPDMRGEAERAGAARLLKKPFEPSVLISMLR
jgi:CheY-like chemotaxis protein